MALISTVDRGRLPLGVGLPLLGFNTPPGPVVKRLGAGRPELSAAWSCLASSSSLRICSWMYGLGLLRLSVGFRFSIAFLTRMISPSFKPRDRIVLSVTSARIVSSILSLSNEEEYRVQSSISHPALRKKSNQSIFGPFLGGGGPRLLDPDVEALTLAVIARGTSSSERAPLRPFAMRRSTYFISSDDIFSAGTSTVTPLIL